jgi:ABC-type antimicrobial peptide transport system permease subunit
MFFYILRRITLLVITLLVLTLGPTSWSFASSPRAGFLERLS